MNDIEKGILGDTIVSIKRLVNEAIMETSKNNYTPDVMYRKHKYLLEMGEDTIKEINKVIDGYYAELKDKCCKGDE